MKIEDEPVSLEYIEDPYMPNVDTITPSLDDDEIVEFDHRSPYTGYGIDDDVGVYHEWSPETEYYLRSMPLEHLFSISDDCDGDDDDELQKVETDLDCKLNRNNCDSNGNSTIFTNKINFLQKLFNRKKLSDVKVTFIDFSKPYLAKISSSENYKNFLIIGSQGKHKIQNEKKNNKVVFFVFLFLPIVFTS